MSVLSELQIQICPPDVNIILFSFKIISYFS